MNSKTIIILIVLLASAVLVWQMTLPFYQEVKTQRSVLTQKQNDLEKQKEATKRIEDLTATYKAKSADFEKIRQMLPLNKEVPQLLAQFESLASQSGLILGSINFSETASQQVVSAKSEEDLSDGAGTAAVTPSQAQNTPYNTLSINLKLTGTYSAFKNFLTNAESNLRMIDIQSVEFSPKEDSGEIMDFSIGGRVYYL